MIDTQIITWIALIAFGGFIFYKFKKFFSLKQNTKSVNYYHTQNFHNTKPRIMRKKKVRYVKSKNSTKDNSIEDKEPKDEDSWSKSLQRDADIANEMFSLGKKKHKGDDYYW